MAFGLGFKRVMRNAVLISCFALTFGLILFLGWSLASSAPNTRTIEMTVISPDGAWQARVYSNVWEGWRGLGSDRQQSVEISSVVGEAVAAPAGNHTVVRFSGERGAIVAVLWKSARHLLIVTSQDMRPAGFLHTVAGIGSSVRQYDPNRPKQTACIAAFRRAVAAGPVVTPPSQCSFWTTPAT